ncbi:MAG: hypothetical protein U5L08_04335 [Xanthomonadales bacterium]|nr:hypothetical protein [Xanthomonadales bacterium]
MKVIETRYKGFRFRSRTEARWAVFLDALGIAWRYEPEGYVLRDGARYLPDFWLPEAGAWLEIKGGEPTREERRKAVLLSDGSKHPVYIVSGLPYWMAGADLVGAQYMLCLGENSAAPENESAMSMIDFERMTAPEFLKKKGFDPADYGSWLAADVAYYEERHGEEHPYRFPEGFAVNGGLLPGVLGGTSDRDRLAALRKMHSARFEFGEGGLSV